jgi:hypothetical protein
MDWIIDLRNRFMESRTPRTLQRGKRDLVWETLEVRALQSTIFGGPQDPGNVNPPAVAVRDLGNVTAAVTTTGARATATLAPGETVVFEASLSISGDFLLWCRFEGTSVQLQYVGPDGSGTIPHGAPGQPAIIPLPLEAGNYQIMVTAPADSGVFIDWELIIANGVGQTPAVAPSLVASAQAIAPMSAPGLSSTQPQPQSQSAPAVVISAQNSGAPASLPGFGFVPEPTLVGRPTLDSEPGDNPGPSTNPIVVTAMADNGAIVEGSNAINDTESDRAALAGTKIALMDWLASLNSRAYLNPEQGMRDLTTGAGETAPEAPRTADIALADASDSRVDAARDGSLVKHAGWLIPVALVAAHRGLDPRSSRRIPKRLSSWIKSSRPSWKNPSMQPSRAGFSAWVKSRDSRWKNASMLPHWQRDQVANG